MSDRAEQEMARWLREATHGLPPEGEILARAELVAHYQDAVEAYRLQGKGPDAAHDAALSDLGEAKTLRRMLRRVHLSAGARLVAGLLETLRMLWRKREIGGTLLFGLFVLGATLVDYTHTVAYSRHLDPVVPVALLIVLIGLITERSLRPWCYAPFGYLLAGVWGWMFLAGPGWLSKLPFWRLAGPFVLPAVVLIGLAILGIRHARRSSKLRISASAWILVGLWLGLGMLEPDFWGRGALGYTGFRTVVGTLVYTLWAASVSLPMVAVGLFGARDGGVAAAMIPLAVQYAGFRYFMMPVHPSHAYASSSPPPLTGLQALLMYLWPVALFVVTPLWVQRARSARGRAAALIVPAGTLIASAVLLGVFGQHSGFEGLAQVAWVKYALSLGQSASLLVLAIVMYRQFEGRDRATVVPPNAIEGLQQFGGA
jgi:hypothetical protein